MTKDEFIAMCDREIERMKSNNKRVVSFFTIQMTKEDWAQVEKHYKDNKYAFEDLTCQTCRKNIHDVVIRW